MFRSLSFDLADFLCKHKSIQFILRQPIKAIFKENSVHTIPLGFASGMKWVHRRHYGYAYLWGIHEYPLQKTLALFLKEGSVFYDLGANFGMFTLVGGKLVGSKGRVFCFEPHPTIAEVLLQNIKINELNNVHLIQKAASEKSGIASFIPQNNTMGHLVSSINELPTQYKHASSSFQVPTVSLDDFIQNNPQPDVIKIDVEGAEINVLMGAQKLFTSKRQPVILIELHSQSVIGKAHELLSSYGYMFYDPWHNLRPISKPKFYTLAIPPHISKPW